MKEGRTKGGPSIVQQELEWLDRLRAKLEPNIGPAVDTLVQLSKTSSREQVRATAASKIIGLYAQCAADSGRLKLQDKSGDDDGKDDVKVVVVSSDQVGEMSQQLAASYQAKRAAARTDVS